MESNIFDPIQHIDTMKCSLYASQSSICIDTGESSDHIVMSIYTENETQSNIPFSSPAKWLWTPINFINNKVPANSLLSLLLFQCSMYTFCLRSLLLYRIQHTATIIYEFNSALYQLQHCYTAAVKSERRKLHIRDGPHCHIFISPEKFSIQWKMKWIFIFMRFNLQCKLKLIIGSRQCSFS